MELAITAAQFMGVKAVHRALARQSLGQLGNDRVFMPEHQRETAPGSPVRGQAIGFENITVAVKRLQATGFGFGTEGPAVLALAVVGRWPVAVRGASGNVAATAEAKVGQKPSTWGRLRNRDKAQMQDFFLLPGPDSNWEPSG